MHTITQLGIGLALAVQKISCNAVARTQTVELVTVHDTTLFEGTNLSNGAGSHMFCGVTGDDLSRRALIRFDLGAVPDGSKIVSARVRLFMSKTSSGAKPVSLHRACESWGEGATNTDLDNGGGQGAPAESGDATWFVRNFPLEPWAHAGGDFVTAPSATIAVTGNAFYEWGSNAAIVQDVQSWINAREMNNGWFIIGDESSPYTAKRFDTHEYSEPTRRPRLFIEFEMSPACTADLNEDGSVDGSDLAMVLGAWGTAGARADLTSDGVVDGADIAVVLGAWGLCAIAA